MAKILRRYEFSERLADILGGSRRDMRFRVTLMVSGGLVTPGPRGPGAPPATPQYAANLLLSALAAPQQADTVEAVRCYRALQPTLMAADAMAPRIVIGSPATPPVVDEPAVPPLLSEKLRFGEVLALLLDHARDPDTRVALARELFGVWVSRGFPVAAVQLGAWLGERRTVVTQRYELPEGERPPAWLDPHRGGNADPGLFHSVFLPVSKLVEIGRLTSLQDERKSPMINLGPTLSNLTNLASQGRNRRPWKRFLSTVKSAQGLVDKIDGRGSRLVEVTGFGSNPGNLRMLTYVPDGLPASAPLVVILHGCMQTAASYDYSTGWSSLADRFGFALLLPEQNRANNPIRCFNWFRAEDTTRDSGEALSIRQMIEQMIADYGIDRGGVHVTGLSAGGAMTSAMLATYPDVFAGGAIIAGVPYGAANGLQEAFDCIFQGPSRSPREWGDRIREASPHNGPWPTISVWHGDADSAVKPTNASEIIKQWSDVHGAALEPTIERTVEGYPHRIWQGPDGENLIESYTITGMSHGAPVKPCGDGGCGSAGPWFHDMGISSTHRIATFWGLTARPEIQTVDRRPSPSTAAGDDAPDAAGEPGDAGRRVPNAFRFYDAGKPEADGEPAAGARKEKTENAPGNDKPAAEENTDVPGRGSTPGINLEDALPRAFEAGGLLKGLREARQAHREHRADRDSRRRARGKSGSAPGVDIQSILSKSFELAGLAANLRGSNSGSSGKSGPVPGVDIQSILSKSFELAGLAANLGNAPPEAPAEEGGPAEPSWEKGDWQHIESNGRAPGDGPLLYGCASSGGDCDVGKKVQTVTCRVNLGQRPALRYVRRLELNAAANVLASASFTVLVDDIPVDEVVANGMDYTEADWTERRNIDLTRFAGRTATLTFELTAKANVCMEVSAKAWLCRIALEDAAVEAEA